MCPCVRACMLFLFIVENPLEGQKKSLPLDGAIMDFHCTKSLWLFWLLEFDHRPFWGTNKTFFSFCVAGVHAGWVCVCLCV